MNAILVTKLIFWCGLGHVALCLGSLLVPAALEWKKHLQSLPLLLRQIFWTYAGYILVTNFSFGIISILGKEELIDGSFLASSVTLFISVYWMTRIAIQFFYFDKTNAPKGLIYTLGEIVLVGAFVVFASVYLIAFLINCRYL